MAGDDFEKLATEIANSTDTDVLLINAGMDIGVETKLINHCKKQSRRRTNLLVFIVTSGGDADVAYRIGRYLQRHYTRITAVISGTCKSAGTLLAIAAHELAFSEFGELGPLDVQLRKADDVWAATSGLTVMNAFTALQSKSEEAFADFALSIKARSGGAVTYKTAADIATKLTTGLFAHIYQQIEVMHVGEAARAMKVAEEYGQRLDAVADNLANVDALGKLIASYPSHGFVIDMEEAKELFANVRELTVKERALCEALGALGRTPGTQRQALLYISQPAQPVAVRPAEASTADAKVDDDDKQGTDTADSAGQEPGTKGAADEAAPAAPAGEGGAQVIRHPSAGGSAAA